ncbi:MAG TPA: hypothetical protein VGP92_13895 [Acidimicrobiia bacterium]|nr:hypothetical protein [Acidimicrobiia bacterium]
MFVVRHPLRKRAFVVLGLVSVLSLAACGGGGGGSNASNTTTPGGAGGTTVTTSGGSGNGKCFTTPGTQHARVRFVNLFTNATYPSGSIDVLQGFSATDPCGKKLATIPYGTASDYVDVTAADVSGNWNATAYVAGSSDEAHQIISQSETWKGGEQITIAFMGSESQSGNSASAGSDQTFFENTGTGESENFPSVPGKAVLGIGASAVQYVAKGSSWRAGIAGQAGCLRAKDDTDTTTTNIGGTSLVQYPVTPGSIKLALYPSIPGTCAGTSEIGPVTIDAAAGSRTFVLVYGPDAKSLKLLTLSVAS